jgi:hypothetical protein
MESAQTCFRRLLKAAARAENLPYTILGCFALISVLARLIMILR